MPPCETNGSCYAAQQTLSVVNHLSSVTGLRVTVTNFITVTFFTSFHHSPTLKFMDEPTMKEGHAKAVMVYVNHHAVMIGGTYLYDTNTVEALQQPIGPNDARYSWKTCADFPDALEEHSAIVFPNGYVCVYGGYSNNDFDTTSRTYCAYEPWNSANKWTRKDDLLNKRSERITYQDKKLNLKI